MTVTTVKNTFKLDRKGKPLPKVARGDAVRVRERAWSRKAEVVDTEAPKSHNVAPEDHRMLRRNRLYLLQTSEHYAESSGDDDDDSSAYPADSSDTELSVSDVATPQHSIRRMSNVLPTGHLLETAAQPLMRYHSPQCNRSNTFSRQPGAPGILRSASTII